MLIYQMLVGTWPQEESELAVYPDRLRQFLIKAVREAKIHSSWVRPNEEYEQALGDFAAAQRIALECSSRQLCYH